jgi:hypothetical protein
VCACTVRAATVLSADVCFEEDIVCELLIVLLSEENVGKCVFLDNKWSAEMVVI